MQAINKRFYEVTIPAALYKFSFGYLNAPILFEDKGIIYKLNVILSEKKVESQALPISKNE
jgi:hypothetical protein